MESPKMPQEQIGDKKEEQKNFAKAETPDFAKELKESEKPKSWLKEKFDKWREQM